MYKRKIGSFINFPILFFANVQDNDLFLRTQVQRGWPPLCIDSSQLAKAINLPCFTIAFVLIGCIT